MQVSEDRELSVLRLGKAWFARGGRAGERARQPATWFVLLLFAMLAALPGPANATAVRISIESGGITRTATLVLHRRLKLTRRPLVIVLRGPEIVAPRLNHVFGLREMLDFAGAALVYPDPVGGHWSEPPAPKAARDPTFIRDLIAKLVTDGLVNRRKVFLVGIGSGGFIVSRLVCDNAALFAGAATLITALPAGLAATCKPSRAIPLLMIVGTADPLVPYNGGKANLADTKIDVLSTDATLSIFGKAAGCHEGRMTTAIPDLDPHDDSRAYVDRLNGCKVPVEVVRVEAGGHSVPGHWPGFRIGPSRMGPHNNDFESAKLIWDFFTQAGG